MKSPEEIITKVNKEGGAYHKLLFPNGTVLKGIYDLNKFIKYYKIPENLSGKTVIDVGTATGYFAFEFVKRGAKRVVAIDKYSTEIQDTANKLMGTNVEFIKKDLMNFDENFEKFDLVFCSNVLQHVSDIFTAITKLKLLTKEQAILCTDILYDEKYDSIPLAHFYGESKLGKEGIPFWSYWQPNILCFKKMAESAGFRKVEEVSNFMLESENGKIKIRNAVLHCFI